MRYLLPPDGNQNQHYEGYRGYADFINGMGKNINLFGNLTYKRYENNVCSHGIQFKALG